MKPELYFMTVHVQMEGEAWGGFTAEREINQDFSRRLRPWPGLKKAIAKACEDWGDVKRDTVRPFYVQIQYCLKSGDWTRRLVKELDEGDLARLGVL